MNVGFCYVHPELNVNSPECTHHAFAGAVQVADRVVSVQMFRAPATAIARAAENVPAADISAEWAVLAKPARWRNLFDVYRAGKRRRSKGFRRYLYPSRYRAALKRLPPPVADAVYR